jgi:capsule polysaccharide export protein KpsE/RkpR
LKIQIIRTGADLQVLKISEPDSSEATRVEADIESMKSQIQVTQRDCLGAGEELVVLTITLYQLFSVLCQF